VVRRAECMYVIANVRRKVCVVNARAAAQGRTRGLSKSMCRKAEVQTVQQAGGHTRRDPATASQEQRAGAGQQVLVWWRCSADAAKARSKEKGTGQWI
jgi:hypothetical protein